MLTASLHILLQEQCSVDELNRTELLLVSYCQDIEALYGIEHCSYNAHLMVHIVQCSKNCGLAALVNLRLRVRRL